ncbi:FtsX-like permease family protein [Stenotrophomonas sp. MMGLT7]|uniref:ABC transporter permease n=1 Tax=Stenotrophomonas sp. MMGLT7 TaxID=2901227 RepID=UPI001E41C917|nr:FtsX-like permease family protein [Stenotrophomonas sp. MMGLT7]MCD7099229.1 ABC transporter permease [Stenotrophomonas sp. MMGLT7]
MSLPLRPILASLRHHRMTTTLLSLQVALTCAIVINAVFLIGVRVERIGTPTGLPEGEISLISVQGVQDDTNVQAQQQTDLAALRAVPGVTAAAAVESTLPLSGGANDMGGCASQAALEQAMAARSADGIASCVEATYYAGSPGFTQALGAHLVSGRDFLPDEYATDIRNLPVIVSQSLAQRMWPDQQAVGKTIYGSSPHVVVGVIDDLLRPRLRSSDQDRLVALTPQLPDATTTQYLLRSAPGDRQRVLRQARDALIKAGPMRLLSDKDQKTFADVRHRYFQRDTTMVGLLLATTLALLFVTALGIGGLASFWVQQRTRQIGIRRAIGATRRDILRYFQAENTLIVGTGAVAGMLAAVALNQWLMSKYELPRLPIWYLPIGALLLWALGQLAVFWPARRAAAVPPVVATRSA